MQVFYTKWVRFFLFVVVTTQTSSFAQAQDLTSLLTKLQNSRAALNALALDGETVLSQRWPSDGPLVTAKEKTFFRCQLSLPPDVNFVYEFTPLVTCLKETKAPFFFEDILYSYNGTWGMRKFGNGSVEGYPASREKKAYVLSSKPDVLSTEVNSIGMESYPMTLKLFNDHPLLEAISSNTNLIVGASVQKSDTNTEPVLVLLVKENKEALSEERLYFLMNRGFALQKREILFETGSTPPVKYKTEMIMNDFKDISEGGIPFPTQFTYKFTKDGVVEQQLVTKIKSVTAMPHVSIDACSPTIEKGYRVQDKRTGISFVVGDSPQSIVSETQSNIDKLFNSN